MRTKPWRIIAQDPSILGPDGRILTTEIDVPVEDLAPGPRGHRVSIVDYNASSGRLYDAWREGDDEYAGALDEVLLSDPRFHARNVYAIMMRTLARIELALGRRVGWSFDGQQIKVAPHAYEDPSANANYSRQDQAIFFGFATGGARPVFACLAHDIIVHETTHAILDGLRERYLDGSSPDQAAFHEGFADVVALLSVFSLRDVVLASVLAALRETNNGASPETPGAIPKSALTKECLQKSVLTGIGKQIAQDLSGRRRDAMRRSVGLPPARDILDGPDFQAPHRRGEVLVAAMMNTFLDAWLRRLKTLGERTPGHLDRERVVEEGAAAADCLLTMAIRALDYAPPVDLRFADYLAALITSDTRIRPDDRTYGYRALLLQHFASFGIDSPVEGGLWTQAPPGLAYSSTHLEALQRDREEVFRFLWENRRELDVDENAYSRVLSVRPCVRVGTDGFILRETVAEYTQVLHLPVSKLPDTLKVNCAAEGDPEVALFGGGILIFDEFGRLLYNIRQRMDGRTQRERLQRILSNRWHQPKPMPPRRSSSTAQLHEARSWSGPDPSEEAR